MAIALIVAAPLFSEAQKLVCTTHSMTEMKLASSEEARNNREQFLREVAEMDSERAGGLKIIPTVIHVIHDGGSENISKQSILDAMEYVNEELRAQNSNLSTVVPEFQSIIGDTEFELRLAKIDASGNCTDGITRTKSPLTFGAGENVKDLVNWNTGSRRYLQVWLVASVGSGAGGYTFLPGSTGHYDNGIIIRTAQFQGSLAHEFGHWMNLNHTWGPTNSPGESTNCFFDDNVNDTPETIGTTGCVTSQTSCGSLDNVQNHMDYSGCARMFTLGQASRMQNAANSSTGGRNSYWASSNLTATGTNDGFAQTCIPNVDFERSSISGCEGFTVDFTDESWGADEDPSWTWSWSFPGGTPSSSSERNPSVTYNDAGVYNVSLTISGNAGSDTRSIQQAITVLEPVHGYVGPVFEGVENSGFPNGVDDLDWNITSTASSSWQRTTSAFHSGSSSVKIDLKNQDAGDMSELTSFPLDMTDVTTSDARMTFWFAHSNRSSDGHSEKLRVLLSYDCGETWKQRFNTQGTSFSTTDDLHSGTFIPTPDEWKEQTVSLSPGAGESYVMVRFETTSDEQSVLYIDDINITPNAPDPNGIGETGVINDARIYPNPINGTSQLELSLNENTDATISLHNTLGQQLTATGRKLQAGINRVALDELTQPLQAGIYFIQIRSDKGTSTVRFVKN